MLKKTSVVPAVAIIAVIAAVAYLSYGKPSVVQKEQFQPQSIQLQSATDPASVATTTTKLPYTYQSVLCADKTDTNDKFNCERDYYKGLVDKYGVPAAFADLKKRYQSDPFTVAQCHPLAHVIGREATVFYPTVSDAYTHGDSFCWSGYYHGVMEGIIAKIGYSALPAKMNTICSDLPGAKSYSFDYYNCVHGLGHGIMELGSDDVFSSLQTCDNLTGAWEKESCYGGVFMENIIAHDRGVDVPDLKPSQPLYPCTGVAAQYKNACYLMQTSYVLEQNHGNFPEMFADCAAVAEPYRDICNQSGGRDATSYANHVSKQAYATCMLAPDTTAQHNCMIGALKEQVSYYHSDVQAKELCNFWSGSEQQSCLQETAAYYKSF